MRWRAGADRVQLPGEVWAAIRDYLAASGRLAGIQDDNYIFAPLAEPGSGEENDMAEAWVRERYLSHSRMLASLKLYGRLARIPEENLTLQTLRRTATRLRMPVLNRTDRRDEGGDIEELKVFLNSREGTKSTKYRLGKLPQLPEQGSEGETDTFSAQMPD